MSGAGGAEGMVHFFGVHVLKAGLWILLLSLPA